MRSRGAREFPLVPSGSIKKFYRTFLERPELFDPVEECLGWEACPAMLLGNQNVPLLVGEELLCGPYGWRERNGCRDSR